MNVIARPRGASGRVGTAAEEVGWGFERPPRAIFKSDAHVKSFSR